MTIEHVNLGTLTQGTIFSCAIADRYPDKTVYGLTITARCDIVHDKFPVLNYLPIVSLQDWVRCDGIDILHKNVLNQLLGRFDKILEENNISKSVLFTNSREKILKVFFDNKDDKKYIKAKEICDNLYELENIDLSKDSTKNWLLNRYDNEIKGIIKELVKNRLQHYYFIYDVTDDNSEKGYVILMRESAFIPRTIARSLANGIVFQSNQEDSHILSKYLNFNVDQMAMPIGQIPSPNIEHILQSFSNMFIRIGLNSNENWCIDDILNQNFMSKGE